MRNRETMLPALTYQNALAGLLAVNLFVFMQATGAQTTEAVRVIASAPDRKESLPGEFLPFLRVAIYAKVEGFVEKVEVDRGSLARAGQLLATITAPELDAQSAEAEAKVRTAESQSAEAEARLVAAQSTYDRMKSASATEGVIAGNEVVQAEKQVDAEQSRVKAAEASVRAAQAALKSTDDLRAYLRVTAPFSGVITTRNVHPGALVGAGKESEPMFELETINRLRLVVPVPEADVGAIVKGAHVSFSVPAYPGETFSGVVSRISRSLDPKIRAMPVELDVPNPNGRLAAGMYPSVNWPVRGNRTVLMVPPSSIVNTSERTFVIRVKNGAAEWVDVKRGAAQGELVEAIGPLSAGDVVLRRGSDEIRQGTRVKVKLVGAAK
jgi:membrane fusion protein, multidrug efflux system